MSKKTIRKDDSDAVLTEVISLRIETSLKEELESEMREKGIHRISKYIRLILEKRKSRSIAGAENVLTVGRKEYENLAEQYKKVASLLAMVQRMKSPDGKPMYDTDDLTRSMDALKDATKELVAALKKHIGNGNQNPE